MIVLGIDPGLSGGLAIYDGETLIPFSTPVNEVEFVKNGKKQKRKEMDLEHVCEILDKYKPHQAFLEKVTARPGQGVTSMFRFGENFGQFQGILTALGIPVTFVTPQTWKKVFELGSEKNASLELAKTLFEGHDKTFKLKKNDGIAEAALIARYGYDLHQERTDDSLPE